MFCNGNEDEVSDQDESSSWPDDEKRCCCDKIFSGKSCFNSKAAIWKKTATNKGTKLCWLKLSISASFCKQNWYKWNYSLKPKGPNKCKVKLSIESFYGSSK